MEWHLNVLKSFEVRSIYMVGSTESSLAVNSEFTVGGSAVGQIWEDMISWAVLGSKEMCKGITKITK